MDLPKVRSRHDCCLRWKVGRRASCSWLVVPAVTHLRVAREHQQVVHGSSFRLRSHLSGTQGTSPQPWGDGKCSPGAVVDECVWRGGWMGCLGARLRRVKRPMLHSFQVTRQRMRMNWTS